MMNVAAALVKMEVNVLMESTATVVDVPQDSLEPTVKPVSLLKKEICTSHGQHIDINNVI